MQHYPGVYPSTKKDGTPYYRASITFKGKHISLGSYDAPSMAYAAYLEADRIIKSSAVTLQESIKRNIQGDRHLLALDKIVSLHNYRDNDIYFVTPIYLQENFFYYYLTPVEILKFDTDDLFYYSSHKIMKRQGHLFVSDYGMQVNINSRYGIRSYAVLGRDYRFLNGDTGDFRYENIQIINPYQGVEKVHKKGRDMYRVRIHVKGNYTVGLYDTVEEGAIAYNKAIDALKAGGINKAYQPNFVENMSAQEYAEIYGRLKISDKLTAMHSSQSQ